jgi:hypothetical protein
VKGYEKKRSSLTLRYYPGIGAEKLRKIIKSPPPVKVADPRAKI